MTYESFLAWLHWDPILPTVPPNEDKPHRCPKCHAIPDEANKDGRALPGKTYVCKPCGVRWVGPMTKALVDR